MQTGLKGMNKFMKRICSIIVAFSVLVSALSATLIFESSAEEIMPDGYSLYTSIGSSGSKFAANPLVLTIENWNEGKRGLNFRDDWGLQRASSSDGVIILQADSTMKLEIGTVVSAAKENVSYNKYYTSCDGVSWVELETVTKKIYTKSDPLPDGYTGLPSASYVAWVETVSALPQNTKQLKIVTGTTESMSWQPGIEYIDIYAPDRFVGAFDGYTAVASLLSQNSTLDSPYIHSHSNWSFGQKGLWYRDQYGTQRLNGKNEDASITVNVEDDMLVEVGSVVSLSFEGVTANTYFTSNDGESWSAVDAEKVVSKRVTSADPLPDGYKGLPSSSYIAKIDRITALPEGTTMLKIVTSTQNTSNSWWQPSIEYIDLYRHPMDIALDGYYKEASLISQYSDLSATQISSYSNWKYESLEQSDEGDRFFLTRPENKTSELTVNVTDTQLMLVKASYIGGFDGSKNRFLALAQDNTWQDITEKAILSVSREGDKTYTQELICDLPSGTSKLKIVTSAPSQGEVSLSYIDLYGLKPDYFALLTKGYEKRISLLNPQNTLESPTVHSYKGWTYGNKGMSFADEWGTQRKNGDNSDAEIVLKITDNAVVEVASVISLSLEGITANTYYTSSDGKSWTAVEPEDIYVKRMTTDDDTRVAENYAVRLERVAVNTPNSKYIKVITTTQSTANSWWQPSLNYIDIYYPTIDTALEGYVLKEQLYQPENSAVSSVAALNNWSYSSSAAIVADSCGLVRNSDSNAEIILNISGGMMAEFCTAFDKNIAGVLSNKFYISVDGKNWTAVKADGIVEYKTESNGSAVLRQLVRNIPSDAKLLKMVTSTGSLENVGYGLAVDFIKLYGAYVDPFDSAFDGYALAESLITKTNTLDCALITEYSNWTYGIKGMPFLDEWGTQREKDNGGDAYLTVSVRDDMRVEVATVIAKAFEGKTANGYFVSPDGKNWQPLQSGIYSRKFYTSQENQLLEAHVGLVERITSLPKGTKYLRIVTTSQNAKNSWWQPSINLINLYQDPFDTALDGTVETEKLFDNTNSLTGQTVVSSSGWSYSSAVPGSSDSKGLKNGGKKAVLVLNVVDTARVEISGMLAEGAKHRFYSSPDGKTWTLLGDTVSSRIFAADGAFSRITHRISKLADGTAFLKMETEGTAFIDSIAFYDNAPQEFDLAFVGYSKSHTLFDSSNKLSASVITGYSNWRYGNTGLNFDDEWGLQRNSGNDSDAELIISLSADSRVEVATVISNSWIKKSSNKYYWSDDGENFSLLDTAVILTREYTSAEDARIKEGYTARIERIISLPQEAQYIKIVTSTGGQKNSWWQPGIDYINIYTPHQTCDLGDIEAQLGGRLATIQFSSFEDGLGHKYISSHSNLTHGKSDMAFSDEFVAKRINYKDSELKLAVDGDLMLEFATVVDSRLAKTAENRYYFSANGNDWDELDSELIMRATLTVEQDNAISADTVAVIELITELPSNTKYVKTVSTTNGYNKLWQGMELDYISVYKGDGEMTLRNFKDSKYIMIVGNFITITMSDPPLTVDDLTAKLDPGKAMIHYLDKNGEEISDGRTVVESGQKLLLKKNGKVKKEYIISVKPAADKPEAAKAEKDGINIWVYIIVSAAALAVVSGTVLAVVIIRRRRKK